MEFKVADTNENCTVSPTSAVTFISNSLYITSVSSGKSAPTNIKLMLCYENNYELSGITVTQPTKIVEGVTTSTGYSSMQESICHTTMICSADFLHSQLTKKQIAASVKVVNSVAGKKNPSVIPPLNHRWGAG